MPGPLRAQTSAAECCPDLLSPVGARMIALGSAVVARPGTGSLFANPAAIEAGSTDRLVVHTAPTPLGRTTAFSVLIGSDLIGTIGVTYRLIDEGEDERTNEQGEIIGVLSLTKHILSATYATRVAEGLLAGLSYKLYHDRQDCRGFCGQSVAATSHTVDAGVQYEVPVVRNLQLGAALLHVGTALQFVNAEQASPMPTRLRLGAAHEVLQYFQPDSAIALWLQGEVNTPVRRPGSSHLNVGAELAVRETLFVWAGYGGAEGQAGGAAIGVGLHYERFELGVAQSLRLSTLDDAGFIHVTFGIRF